MIASACSASPGEHRLHQVEHRAAVGEAQHVGDRVRGDRLGPAAGLGDRLVEQREPVARRAVGGARDQVQRVRRGRDLLLLGDAAEQAGQLGDAGSRRRSKRWQRERTVTGTLRISVVAKTNFTCGGGSSSVFSSALNALRDSMWTSSMMKTL